MKNIPLPQINHNGTSGENLLEEYQTAINAIRAAKLAYHRVTVHGRDYVDYAPAREHRESVFDRLSEIEKELEFIEEHIAEQGTFHLP